MAYHLQLTESNCAQLTFSGDWQLHGADATAFSAIEKKLKQQPLDTLVVTLSDDCQWDSRLISTLLLCHNYCQQQQVTFNPSQLPTGATKLLALATAVPAKNNTTAKPILFDPFKAIARQWRAFGDFVAFIGECAVAMTRLITGRANMRITDLMHFLYLAGPKALGIITLLSILVGMILAYLGAVQLKMFGAEVYVASLVSIGMVREMGALMTAIIMAGRTGASYAAQLGTMQVNDEIDAVKTLGISPIEFLVLPRMLALVLIMPLLCIYADILGIIGGAIVALGMDVTLLQYIEQSRQALDYQQVLTGVFKSLVFGVLIAVAGCRAGIECGRDSAAVGSATTRAVVTAIVYLVISDAILNIIYSELGI